MASSPEIKTIAVIGTGVIGASYVALFLAKGLRVIASPTKADGRSKLQTAVAQAWPVLEKAGLAEGASQDNLEFVDDVLKHLDRVDLVQENGPETLDYKIKTFAALDAGTAPHVPLISSTSGFPASKFVRDCTKNPGRVLIAHPFNPPHLIPAVEVVPHPQADAAIVDRVMEFFQTIGQRPVRVNMETPGFVLNRLQAALLFEAYSLVARGVISARDLDAAVTSGIGLRWALSGPFMNTSLSGGGGAEGFRRVVEHLGPPAEVWRRDMEAHRWDVNSDEAKQVLAGRVGDMFDEFGDALPGFLKARDDSLSELVVLKQEKGLP